MDPALEEADGRNLEPRDLGPPRVGGLCLLRDGESGVWKGGGVRMQWGDGMERLWDICFLQWQARSCFRWARGPSGCLLGVLR